MLNLYSILLSLFNEDILKIPGIRYIKKYNAKEIAILDNTSLKRWTWVFLYTAQKHPK